MNDYSQNKGKKIVEKIIQEDEQWEFQEDYKDEIANFNLLEYLYGIKKEIK